MEKEKASKEHVLYLDRTLNKYFFRKYFVMSTSKLSKKKEKEYLISFFFWPKWKRRQLYSHYSQATNYESEKAWMYYAPESCVPKTFPYFHYLIFFIFLEKQPPHLAQKESKTRHSSQDTRKPTERQTPNRQNK